MHDHSICKHEIEYCSICDVCFCRKCKSEWSRKLPWTYSIGYTTNMVETHHHPQNEDLVTENVT